MKPKDRWFLAIGSVLCVGMAFGPKWYLQVQKDRGDYTYGYTRGEAARITASAQPTPESDPILRDERARRFYDEGYADALSHSPPRYPYAPLRVDPRKFAPDETK
jgi:hypothetical protein